MAQKIRDEAQDLFLPQEQQPEDLIRAVHVIEAPEPRLNDVLFALNTIEDLAAARLVGASIKEAHRAAARLAEALGYNRLIFATKLKAYTDKHQKKQPVKPRKGGTDR
ncbi:hypothetical protein AB9K35_22085 [Leisingera sp. XS_AS12]|jgi:hypothetical protein|uniref:hypothetical protein n=1 Tax=Leisingera sp. XS_AS12 TaxID=3241294 RepID=UPI00351337B9